MNQITNWNNVEYVVKTKQGDKFWKEWLDSEKVRIELQGTKCQIEVRITDKENSPHKEWALFSLN